MKHVFTMFFLLLLAGGPLLADSPPGGDVLRPKRAGASEFQWYLGLDGGLTWSSFYNGPADIFAPNPFFRTHSLRPTIGDPSWVGFPVNSGNGIGFTIAGVVDLAFSKHFGLVGKLNYHTRKGNFDQTATFYNLDVYQNGLYIKADVTFHDKHDWELRYLGFDLLARIQIVPESWYVLIGPSFSSLSKNTFNYNKSIVGPADIYFLEESLLGVLGTPNQLTTMSGSYEVPNLETTRVDVKAGLGTWIPLSETLFLTPEVSLAYPLTKLESNMDYNMFTVFATIGLRWKMD